MPIERDGYLTAFLIYWELHCDAEHAFSNGPYNPRLVAWDQSVRNMPIEARVCAGERVTVHAHHDYEAVRVGVPEIRSEWLRDAVGHAEVLQQGFRMDPRGHRLQQ